jgi:flagellar biosynthesis GTPase FlhF
MTGLPPSNGHYRQESGHSRKRTLVEMSDDDQDGLGSSHLGKPISMNGNMNGHKPNKKAKKTSMNGNSGTLNHNIELQKQRVQLPIHSGMSSTLLGCTILKMMRFNIGKEALVREIRENDVTVLLGETGSGKTTRA